MAALASVMRTTPDEVELLLDVLEEDYGISPMVSEELEREYKLSATIPVVLEHNEAVAACKKHRAKAKPFVPKIIGRPCRKKGKG